MTVIDLIYNEKEVLKFESKKNINVGYYPEKPGHFKGLLLMSDATFQLIDRWDNTFHFDRDRKLMAVNMGVENRWFYNYSGEKIVGVNNGDGCEISFEYDKNGMITRANVSNKKILNYNYDSVGNPEITDSYGKVYSSSSDNHQFLQKLSMGLLGNANKDNGKWVNEYDEKKVTKMRNGKGCEIQFQYDQNGRITKSVLRNEGKINYEYDKEGNLVKIIELSGSSINYQYDGKHRLINLTKHDTRGKSYQ